jgi:hypothetical protein
MKRAQLTAAKHADRHSRIAHLLAPTTPTRPSRPTGGRRDPPPQPRFPPPWTVEDTGTGSAFVVIDSSGQKLLYYEEEPGRRSAAKMLTKDEAPRIAANVAKLLELVR